MDVVVSGASGLVGSALCRALASRGTTVRRLVRRPAGGADEIRWDPAAGRLDPNQLDGCQAVVHLAGENIAHRRWSRRQRERIRASRVESTRLVAEAMAASPRPPGVLVNASAIGYYGDRGEELLDESAPPGDDFLARVCQAWEAATAPATGAGIRVVRLRIGVVLSRDGGALAKMLTPFRFGLGGRVGSGRQYWSWIALDDLVRIILHVLDDGACRGPVNAVSPRPVTNAEFTRTLAAALHRPAILPMPAPAVRLLFGQMGQALLLASTRVVPARLQGASFVFRYPRLEDALTAILQRRSS